MGAGTGAIVIGGGHNGLICATYLARAGVAVVVVEARDTVGGCASTVDALDGTRVNVCNCDHTLTRTTPIIDELDLASFGLRYLDIDPAVVNVPLDGSAAWPLFHDVERTIESLSMTHPSQVDGYRRYVAAARPVAELLIELANEVPSPRVALRRLAARRARGVATLLRWSRMCVADVLGEFFTDEAVRSPAIVGGPAVWGVSPFAPGTGLGAISYAMKHVAPVGRPVGGSGAFPDAVRAALEHAGGCVRTGAQVERILCDGDRVRGVALAGGAIIEAPIVVSACDPRRTFVEWLTPVPDAARSLIERWRAADVRDGYESKIDAVIGELPFYRQLDAKVMARLGADALEATTIVAPSTTDVHTAHQLMAQGRVAARPMMLANVPSVRDPTMAVGASGGDGGHVFSLEVLFTPYALDGGWTSSDEPARWLRAYGDLVQPGWLDGVRRYRAMTPDRYEREFNLPRGYATSFGGGPLAALRGRPAELTRYSTRVRGLYLTGAATFPGAGVWGASGRNCARVILGK